ncbi:unnamed protein product [Haemonchus placei]|uniref:Ataxin-2 homolog n=1 Tax=Haemonchus placei TaxID=6290 RepID=A0A0N4W959_HAEPC|nr:unnamed protein product [Haemonchus placei]
MNKLYLLCLLLTVRQSYSQYLYYYYPMANTPVYYYYPTASYLQPTVTVGNGNQQDLLQQQQYYQQVYPQQQQYIVDQHTQQQQQQQQPQQQLFPQQQPAQQQVNPADPQQQQLYYNPGAIQQPLQQAQTQYTQLAFISFQYIQGKIIHVSGVMMEHSIRLYFELALDHKSSYRDPFHCRFDPKYIFGVQRIREQQGGEIGIVQVSGIV